MPGEATTKFESISVKDAWCLSHPDYRLQSCVVLVFNLSIILELKMWIRVALALALGLAGRCQIFEDSLPSDPGPLDFIRGEGYEQIILQSLVGDALVGLSPTGAVVPRLAEHWKVQGHTLTFQLRAGVCFADGTPVRAEDVVWTLRTLQADPKASPTKKAMVAGIHLEARGSTVRVSGVQVPNRTLMELARIPITRKGSMDLGSGPYTLTRTGDDLMFKARPHFLAPRIKEFRLRILPDPAAVMAQLKKGWLTVGAPTQRAGQVPPQSHREVRQATNAQVIVWSQVGTAPLRLLEACRSEALPEGFLGSRARCARGLWPESLGFPPRAMAQGPLPAKGSQWEIIYPAGDETVEKALLSLRAVMGRKGYTLNLRSLEPGLNVERLLKGDFTLACATQIYEPHPWSVLEILAPDGPLNLARWQHPRVPPLLKALDAPGAKAWEDLHKLWAESPTCLPILDLESVLWVDKRLDFTPTAVGMYLCTPGPAAWQWR